MGWWDGGAERQCPTDFIKTSSSLRGFLSRKVAYSIVFCLGILTLGMIESYATKSVVLFLNTYLHAAVQRGVGTNHCLQVGSLGMKKLPFLRSEVSDWGERRVRK